MADWQPSASLATLKIRARLLQRIRAFFQARDVLEVETPLLSSAAVTDPHIESYAIQDPHIGKPRYLHTSPEFAMKRLLAAGSGSIYQICKIFRQGEVGQRHNPTFPTLDCSSPSFDNQQIMALVAVLVTDLLHAFLTLGET